MTRTKLCDRTLPDYTRGEEWFSAISHMTGGALGIAALVLCVVRASLGGDPWGIVGGAIYGAMLVILYSVSSVYHALKPEMGKKVMQVIDHCTIYFLIAGTYTPILFCAVRSVSSAWCWVLFGIVWGLAFMAATLTAIDLKRFSKLSMACYVGMGWCIVIAIRPVLASIALPGIIWLVAGGLAYTVGAVLYGIGKKHRYVHSVFHLFVLLGSICQFVCIYHYVLI